MPYQCRVLSVAIALSLGLASCGVTQREVVNVRTDFAKTNYGYINSGGYRAGSLFAWNKPAGQLVFLDNVPGFEPQLPDQGTDSKIVYEYGLTTTAEVSLAVKAHVDAVLKSDATIEVKDARRVPVSGVVTKITEYMKSNADLYEEWGFRESVGAEGQYFMIVRDVTYGDSLDIRMNSENSVSGGFPIKVADASFDVKLTGKGIGNLSGSDIPIIMNVYVLKAGFVDNGAGGQNPSFTVVRDVDLKGLPDLFRSVGGRS